MTQIRKKQVISLQAHWNFYNYSATGSTKILVIGCAK